MAQEAVMQLTPELLISIIKFLCGMIGAIVLLFISVIGILHKGMTRRLDLIELDLKPLLLDIGRHEEQIKGIKDEQADQRKWLGHHDTRIQGLERQVASIK